MSSNALKALAGGLVVVAIVLGFLAYKLTPGLQAPPPVENTQDVESDANQVLAVIAIERIPAYEPIKAESVVLAPISVEPEQYYTDTQEVVGRIPLRDISLGIPVTSESFSAANTLAHAIPEGMRAMSLEISDVVAVGGFVKPGDIVDVIVYLRSSGRQNTDSQARLLLEKTRVLAYQERLINATAEDKAAEGGQKRQQRTAVLAVPVEDTTRVMLGASLGELRLALRPAEDVNFDSSKQFVQAKRSDADEAQSGDSTSPSATDQPKPEALAPRSVSNSEEKVADKGKPKAKEAEPITLAELAGLKKKRQTGAASGKPRPAPRPRARIEVYEGPERSSVTRSF